MPFTPWCMYAIANHPQESEREAESERENDRARSGQSGRPRVAIDHCRQRCRKHLGGAFLAIRAQCSKQRSALRFVTILL